VDRLYILKFPEDNFTFGDLNSLKFLQEIDYESLIMVIIPVIVGMLNAIVFFREHKEVFMILQKRIEQALFINVNLYPELKLVQEMEFFGIVYGQVAILLPFVFEVVFNLDHDVIIDLLVRVEHPEHSKEPREVITVIER
tara:strand:+ start:392 stop:811 length:420 start_codon:yes stop_codon:yes gene_type:complete